LFVARGNLDGMNPGELIRFIEKSTNTKMGDVGNIDVMREFSFINVKDADADIILRHFKDENPRKPLIVEAKSKDGGGSR
jgi:hypothetical protein